MRGLYAAVVGAVVLATIAIAPSPQPAQAADALPGSSHQTAPADHQTDDTPPSAGDDTTVWVQTYTILAAGAAAAAFLLLFLIRIALGRGPVTPPPQEDAAGHH